MAKLYQAAAEWLYTDIENGHDMRALPEQLAVQTLDESYRVQEALQDLYLAAGVGAIAGWKIALTTPTMQQFVGIDHPTAGAIFDSRVHQSGVTLQASDYVNLGVETEIALRLGRDLKASGGPYNQATVAQAVAGIMASTELVDDRNVDYSNPDVHLLIAANSLNAGCVLGPEQAGIAELDLMSLQGAMRINGEEVGTGVGADVLGHPLAALAWLANHLSARGRDLLAGQVVMTGSVVKTAWLKAGDHMESEISGLGVAELKVG